MKDVDLSFLSGLVSAESRKIACECIDQLDEVWKSIDHLVLRNQARVLQSFIEERISSSHLVPTTGYGYQDTGREGLDKVYARVFGGEEALVRLNWASGTHVIKTALFGLLKPKDHLLSITGTPYDTLEPVIKALTDLGVSYAESDVLLDYQDGKIDLRHMEEHLENIVRPETKVIFIQRSRGYQLRKTVSLSALEDAVRIISTRWPEIDVVVDNCYCEFTGPVEPPSLGASLTLGSLIKNPGGGLSPTGGYVVGKKEAVEKVADCLFAPGLGKEVGSNPYGYREVYQGLFLAPKVVGEALKGATFAALFFSKMGYEVDPGPWDQRNDIVQTIILRDPDALKALAWSIQKTSPVDSFAQPLPWDMPGYSSQVIMAAGTFVQGSSIELSCDAPFIPPYAAFLQGCLTKEHAIIACMAAFDELKKLGKKN